MVYIRDSIALRFEPFKRMYENGSKIVLNSTCSKGLNTVMIQFSARAAYLLLVPQGRALIDTLK